MKTLKLLLLLFVPLFVKAQTVQYLGTNNNIVEVRNAFNLPKDSIGSGNIRLKDTTLQYKVGSSWRVVGSGGGSTVFAKNGLRKQGDTVKLGLELAPPFTNGLISEPTYLISGNIGTGNYWGMIYNESNATPLSIGGKPRNTFLGIDFGDPTGGFGEDAMSFSVRYDSACCGTLFTMRPDSMTIGSNIAGGSFSGLNYYGDYSSNYTDRSIPDVGWVKSKASVDTTVKILASTNTATPTNIASINIPAGHVWDLQIRAIARSSSTEAAKFLKTAIVGNNGTASLLDGGLVDIIADMQTSGMTETGLELLTSGSEIIVRATGINGDVEWKIYITINTLP